MAKTKLTYKRMLYYHSFCSNRFFPAKPSTGPEQKTELLMILAKNNTDSDTDTFRKSMSDNFGKKVSLVLILIQKV